MNKNDLLTRLIKEGHITFDEAMMLNETEKEYIYTQPFVPYPYYEDWQRTSSKPWWANPMPITCNTITHKSPEFLDGRTYLAGADNSIISHTN